MNTVLLRQDCRARVSMLLGLACVGFASGQPYPNIRYLPRASGGLILESAGHCISGDGRFVGGNSWDESGRPAYRWGGPGVTFLTRIGALPSSFAGATVQAFSHDGEIAVGTSSSFFYSNEAFVSYSPGFVFGLGVLDERFNNSYANGVSADGNVVVGTLQRAVPSGFTAFRWTPSEGMRELPALAEAPQNWRGEARGVSADGRVIVGWSGLGAAPTEVAVRWVDGGLPQPLGDIPGGSQSSTAIAASADGGVIVGTIRPLPPGLESQLFRWTESDGMQLLGNLPGRGDATEAALAVSADGTFVVGVASSELYTEEAMIWEPFNGLRRIATLAGDASLFQLDRATGISADGRVISGTATISTGFGRTVAWRAELWPPRCRREDIDNDRVVGLTDLATLLSNFGEEAAQYYDGDLTLDRLVSLSDLAVLLRAFGTSCE